MENQTRIFNILNRIQSYDCSYKVANFTAVPLSASELIQLELAVNETSIISNIIWDKKQTLDENTRKIEKIISQSNNEGVYPSAYEYGLLSNASCQQNMVGEKAPVEASQQLYLQDWHVSYILNDTESSYYGVIYQNNKTCNYVLAHRGAYLQEWQELFTKGSGIQYILENALQSEISTQNLQAYLITKKAAELSKTNFYLSFTGFSSGGDLATLSGYYVVKESLYSHAKVVTFNSLGAASIIEDLESNIITNKIDLHAIDVTHYMSIPDILNTFHPHLGKTYRVFPKLDLKTYEDLKKKYLPNIPRIEILEGNLFGYLTIFDNTLSVILKEFDPNTGLPRFSKEMRDWPCGTCDTRYKMSSTVEEVTTTVMGSILGAAANKVLSAAQYVIGHMVGGEKQFSNVKSPSVINKMLADTLLNGRSIVLLTNLFYDILSGKLKQSQYWKVFEKQVKYELRGDKSKLSDEGKFDLIYKGHYRESDVDLSKMSISKDSNPLDLILYLLRIQSVFLDNLNVNEFLREELKKTASEYSLETEWGRVTIVLNYDSNLDVIKVKEKITKLSHVSPIANALLNIQHAPKLNTKELYFEAKIPYLRDKNFIDRKNILKNINESLFNNEVVLLRGMDGVGKTAIAMEFGYVYKKDGGLIRWFSGNSKVALDSGFRQFAEDLDFILVGDETPEEIKSNIYKKLYHVTQPILLIFDDVIDKDLIKFYLRELPDNIMVLITSTQKALIDGTELVMGAFSEEEAIAYVKTHIQLEIDQIEQLINYVGKFPLKLKYAVTYLKDNEYLTIEEYMEEAKEDQNNLVFERVFSVLGDILKENELRIVSCLALLKYTAIPLPFIKTYLNRQELKNLMLVGKKLSMFKITDDRKSLSIDVEIQQELLRYLKFKYGDELILKQVNDLAERLDGIFPNLNDKSVKKDQKTASLYITHIKKLLEFEGLNLSIKVKLSLKFADYLIYHNHDYLNGIDMYEANLKYATGENTIIVLLKKLANTYVYLNDYQKALQYYNLAESKLESKSDDNIKIGLFIDIARLYLHTNKFDKSTAYYRKALDLSGTIDINKIIILTELGKLNILVNKFSGALVYLEDAHNMYQDLHGELATIELSEILNQKAISYYYDGMYEKSLQYFEDALSIKTRLYGDGVAHPEIAKLLNNKGNVYYEQKNYEDALKYQEEALRINKKAYQDVPNILTARYMSNIANSYSALKKYDIALQFALEALSIKKEIFEDIAHDDIIQSFCDVASIYSNLKTFETAFQYFHKCLHMSEELYKDGHLSIVDALYGVGTINIERGYIGDGLDYYMQACSMMEYLQTNEYPYLQMQDAIREYENFMHNDECTMAYSTIVVLGSDPVCEFF